MPRVGEHAPERATTGTVRSLEVCANGEADDGRRQQAAHPDADRSHLGKLAQLDSASAKNTTQTRPVMRKFSRQPR